MCGWCFHSCPLSALAGGTTRFVLRIEDGNWDSSVRCCCRSCIMLHVLNSRLQHAHSGGSGNSSRHACRAAKLQPLPLHRVQHSNVRVLLLLVDAACERHARLAGSLLIGRRPQFLPPPIFRRRFAWSHMTMTVSVATTVSV